MGRTTIYTLLFIVPIIVLLVTVNLHSKPGLDEKSPKLNNTDNEVPDVIKHKVKSGDNLTSLAYMYRTTVKDIKELNKLTRNNIYLGEVLNIPYNTEDFKGEESYVKYKVYKGDSLSVLASKFRTDLDSIKGINNLNNNQINYGQRLNIPYGIRIDTNENDSYKTQNSDEMLAIEESTEDKPLNILYNSPDLINTEEIDGSSENQDISTYEMSEHNSKNSLKYNNLESNLRNDLMDNQYLVDSHESVKFNDSDDLPPGTNDNDTNSILKDDNNKYNRDIALNEEADVKVFEAKDTLEYIVKRGDNLSSIAEEFHATATELKELNKLNTTTLKIGQKISIPKHDFIRYRIQRDDNLSTIAVKYNTTLKELKRINDMNSEEIYVGQRIKIPRSDYKDVTNIAKTETDRLSDSESDTEANVSANKISDKSEIDTKTEGMANLKEDKLREQSDSKVEMNIDEAIKQFELQTDKDNIQNNIKSFASNTTPDKVESTELAESKKHNNDSILDQNSGKQPDKIVLASVKDQTVVPKDSHGQQPENNDELNQQVPQTAKDDQDQNVKEINSEDESKDIEVALKSDVKSRNVERSDSKELKEDNFDVPDKISDGTDLNSPGDITNRKKSSISDLEFKHEDDESDLKNKVTLAQLLTLENSTVQKEQDRYHSLVEEQAIIARNDYNDIYAQKSGVTTKSVETTESGEEIVNFPGEIDLRDLVRTMSEITNESFIIDDKLQSKKVTIITPKGGFSKNNAIRLFEAILDLNGFTVYRNGPINIVTEKRDIKSVPLPIQEGISIGSLSERFITQIVPLKNINAQDVASTLKPLISREGDIVVYDPLNTLIIVETKTNLNKILIILNNIDKEKEVVFVKIYNSEASDISAMLTEIFGGTTASPVTSADQGDSRTRRRATTRRRAPRTQQSSTEGQVDISGFKIITDDRTNSLIVIAYPEDIPKIKAAIERLDVVVDQPEHGIYVIKLKNADAEQIVNVLNSLISGTQITAQRSGERSTGAARTNQAGASVTTSASLTEFEIEDVRITADIATNTVIIVGSRREFESISRVVDELDIRRKQVYVEAAIMEVALEQLKSMGTNLSLGFTFNDDNLGFGGTNLPGVPSLLGAAADAQNAVTAVGSLSGMFLGVIGEEVDVDGSGPIPPIPSFTALYQALASITDVNILSTPSIVTTDNEEAEILVADVIPFPTGSTVGDSGVTVSTIDREPVGIRLTITPQIGDGDYLNLQLQTEVSNVRPSPPDLNTEEFGITTATRSATSNVVVRNRQTIVIGGLVQDRENAVENKVPALGDIPILGNFFKFRSKSSQKINLMILLTPRIIEDQEDIKLILEDRQKRNMLLQDRNIDEQRLLLE